MLTILENYEKILKYFQIKKYVLNNKLCNFYNIKNMHALKICTQVSLIVLFNWPCYYQIEENLSHEF